MRRIKRDLTIKEKIQKLDEDKLIGRVFKIIIRHLSEDERETFREKATMALVLEIESLKKDFCSLYDQHTILMSENELLKKKLKVKNDRHTKRRTV